MDYDSVILDTETLTDLNATLVDSLKDFVQKKGGGLLLFGPAEKGRELLGGLVPAKEVERILVKDNLSLVTLEEPLFRPEDGVDEMKPFLPGRLPGFFVKEQNPAARGVVVSRANGRSVLVVQAYGAGKVGYWGVPHDWRRSMSDEDGAWEFRKFWQALVQWLSTGGEDRLKIEENEKPFLRGGETPLQVEALGSDFEPSMDAMVKARIVGPEGFEKTVQLYPEGSVAGRYAGSFKPTQPGAYEVRYELTFPDGEALERESYLRVSDSGEESIDVSYAERDLKMLAKLTGGEFLPVSKLNEGWGACLCPNPAEHSEASQFVRRVDFLCCSLYLGRHRMDHAPSSRLAMNKIFPLQLSFVGCCLFCGVVWAPGPFSFSSFPGEGGRTNRFFRCECQYRQAGSSTPFIPKRNDPAGGERP